MNVYPQLASLIWSKWDCFILYFRFFLCCGYISHWWSKVDCVYLSSMAWWIEFNKHRRRRCRVHDHCHQDWCYVTTWRISEPLMSGVWSPSSFFLSSGLQTSIVSCKLHLLLHFFPLLQGKGAFLLWEVFRAHVPKDFVGGKLLSFAIQLHNGADMSKKFSREDAVCDTCHLDFKAFAEMK